MSVAVALAVLFTLGWIPVFVCRTEQFGDAILELTRAERIASVVAVTAMSLHTALGCTLVGLVDVPAWRAVLAAVVYLGGIGLWFWGRSQISPLWMRRLPAEPPLHLRCDGAFGIVRHPLYCGMLIAAGAVTIAAAQTAAVASYGICVAAIVTRTLQEERRLVDQLGAEYGRYARRVSRLLPGIW